MKANYYINRKNEIEVKNKKESKKKKSENEKRWKNEKKNKIVKLNKGKGNIRGNIKGIEIEERGHENKMKLKEKMKRK